MSNLYTSRFGHGLVWSCMSQLKNFNLKNLMQLCSKRDARVSFPPFSWGTILPLIGQTAHGRMAGIIVLTVWPIRGNFVPHENGGKLTLASLFKEVDKQN